MVLPKSILVIALLLGVSLGVFTGIQEREQINKSISAELNGQPIQLEIADSGPEQYQGLSDRSDICTQCGMLFVYPEERPLAFVMRRMQFPLDIVWIKEGRVIGVSYNLPPEQTEPYTLYNSPEPADTVLELKAGGAQVYNLETNSAFNLSVYDKTK